VSATTVEGVDCSWGREEAGDDVVGIIILDLLAWFGAVPPSLRPRVDRVHVSILPFCWRPWRLLCVLEQANYMSDCCAGCYVFHRASNSRSVGLEMLSWGLWKQLAWRLGQ
jgi:hypothetical protein